MWPGNIRAPNPNGSLQIITPTLGPECTPQSYWFQDACRWNTALTSDLLPSSRQVGFFGTVTLRLSAKTDLYTEVIASQSLINHEDPPTPVSQSAAQHGTAFVLPASSPYYPTGLTLPSNWSLAYRTVPLGPATTEVDSRNVKLLVGIRSQQWGWDLDGAVSTNRSWARETLSGVRQFGELAGGPLGVALGLSQP